MSSKYPIILVHGIMIKDFKFFRAFGRIEKVLKSQGYLVFTAKTDGMGTIENNAVQLKAFIQKILFKYNVDKVNIIAHSKGGLDSRHMIMRLGMENKVASLTTLCTPHGGAKIAEKILGLPSFLTKIIAFWLNLIFKIFGDSRPNALQACRELSSVPTIGFSQKVYCQSYSTTLDRSMDDFIMGIPLIFTKIFEAAPNDGLVAVESTKFGNYRGAAVEGSYSHTEIVDFMVKKKKREKIHAFYSKLCGELAELGY